MIHVCHLITGLEAGGAEAALARLVTTMDTRRFRSDVVSMVAGGAVAQELRERGVTVTDLAMARGVPSASAVWRLARLLRRDRPDLLQTWLYHADLLGLVAGVLAGVRRIAWNLRSSNLDLQYQGTWSPRTRWLLTRLSGLPTAVLANSEAGRRSHERLGYRPRRWEVIPNGFDVERFRPDPEARKWLRRELGVPASCTLIGLVARYHPIKDHANFVRASARLDGHSREVHFVLLGCGVDPDNPDLERLIGAHGLRARIHLLGERRDVAEILAGLDVATLSSAEGEGFPNVLGEAMASGVPCVSTDTGDAAVIVGPTGVIVPVRDPVALASAWERLMAMGPDGRRRLGMAARQRIANTYSLPAVVARYEGLYEELCRV